MTLLEPDVALTDFGLAVECAVLAWLVRNGAYPQGKLRFWFVVFFAALGIAALMGGIDHGLIADKRSLAHASVWTGTLLAIGIASLAGWAIGAHLALPTVYTVWITRIASISFAAYAVVVLLVSQSFAVAVIYYLPAAAFLFIAFVTVHIRYRTASAIVGAGSVALMFVAAAVQHSGFGLHSQYFNHNALYHVIQGVALILLFRAARTPRAIQQGRSIC